MSAILSVSGKNFDPVAALKGLQTKHKVEDWTADGKKHTKNGFQIIVSSSSDLTRQVNGVILFISAHLGELKEMRKNPDIETFDFRIAYFWYEDVAALTYELPAQLHLALAHVKATLTFCAYRCSGNRPAEEPAPTAK